MSSPDKEQQQYVCGKHLHKRLSEWIADRQQDPELPIPEDVALMCMDIVRNLSLRYNFYRYSDREDMIADALLTICRGLKGFDPSRKTSAFAYVTQIGFNAFVKHISDESHEKYTQMLYSEEFGSKEAMDVIQHSIQDNEQYAKWKEETEPFRDRFRKANRR